MTYDPLAEFGQAMKTARKLKGWSLETLAAEALGNGDRKGYCSQVERGQRRLSAGTIQNFARALELPEDITNRALLADTPAQDQAEQIDQTTAQLLTDLDTLRDKLKISVALAIALTYKYAEGDGTELQQMRQNLEAAFQTAADQQARDALPSNIDAAVDMVLRQVAALNEDGQVEEADALLMAEIASAKADLDRKQAELTRYYQRAINQAELTNNADAYAARQLELIQLDAPSPEDHWQAMNALFAERYQEARRTAAPFLLTSAIGLARRCIDIAPTEHQRAGSHINLGIALQNHGLRTDGPRGASLLAEAVTAYDTAFAFFTRDAHPTHWAMTQNNKAAALKEQGTRTEGAAGAALLAHAVAAYDAALEVHTREAMPVQWATTQNNKGIALHIQGTRAKGAAGEALLAQAVAAFDAALEVHTREAVPVDWAMTQNNKGNALSGQGTRTEGAAGASLLAHAVAAYDAALEVRTRDAMLVPWAETQENLAIAKLDWANHDTTTDPSPLLIEALNHVEAALTIFDPEHMSYNHAKATRLRDLILAALDNAP
ncbi:MAG: helix-turn-helix transcriptional regulator [Pseudomonadota bacterium]